MQQVNTTPALPNAGNATDIPGVNTYENTLSRSLTYILGELARRANGTLPKDGTEPMTGALNMGGFSISNANDVAASTVHTNAVIFPASQVTSGDPNTLDDYEEGTFTPAVAFGGASVGVTYNSRSGKYTKVGNVVTFNILITLSNKGSSVGAVTLTGLPFTVAQLTITAMGMGAATGLTGNTKGLTGTTSTSILQSGAGGDGAITDANIGNTTQFFNSGVYLV